MIESAAILAYTLSLLRSDDQIAGAITGVYLYRADQCAAMPFVVIADRTSTPWSGLGHDNRLGSDITLSIKVIGEGDTVAALVPVANRIDALLEADLGTISATDSTPQIDILGWRKESDLSYPDPSTATGGKTIHHLGGIYRALTGITR